MSGHLLLLVGRVGAGAGGALLDVLGGGGAHQVVYEHAGGVDVVGADLAGVDEVLGLGEGGAPAHRGQGVEVPGGEAVAEVAVGVGGVGVDEGDVGVDGAFEHVVAAVELGDGLALGDGGAVAGGGVEGGAA